MDFFDNFNNDELTYGSSCTGSSNSLSDDNSRLDYEYDNYDEPELDENGNLNLCLQNKSINLNESTIDDLISCFEELNNVKKNIFNFTEELCIKLTKLVNKEYNIKL